MKALVLVARREIVERRMVFVAGLIFGLLPLVTPLLPGVTNGRDARGATALFLLAALAWGAALILGASVWAKDLSDGRLGFWFSRPVSPASIFGGKLLGAAALVVGASLLVVLPTALIDGPGVRHVVGSGAEGVWVLCVVFALLLLPLAHAASVAIRAHDAWIAADLLALAGCSLLVASAARSVTRIGFLPLLGFAIVATIALLPLVALVAGFVHASRARTDVKRSHTVLSTVLWGTMLPICAVAAAGAWWFTHPNASSLREIFGSRVDPSGRWGFVMGSVRHRGAMPFAFLVDVKHPGRELPLGEVYESSIQFAQDGSRAAWLRMKESRHLIDREPGSLELVLAHLEGPRIELRLPQIGTTDWGSRIALSPRGTRLAFRSGGDLTVLDTATEKTVFAARVEDDCVPRFLDEDRIRLVTSWGRPDREAVKRPLAIWELTLSTRRLERTGEVACPPSTWIRGLVEANGSRLLLLVKGGPSLLCDGRTGALLATLPVNTGNVPAAAFLSDGRIVVGVVRDGHATLLILGRDGREDRRVDLGAARNILFGAQPEKGLLPVALISNETKGYGWDRSRLVDLDAGRVVRELPGLYPATGVGGWWILPATTLDVGPVGRLFVDHGHFIELDPASGARRPIPFG